METLVWVYKMCVESAAVSSTQFLLLVNLEVGNDDRKELVDFARLCISLLSSVWIDFCFSDRASSESHYLQIFLLTT